MEPPHVSSPVDSGRPLSTKLTLRESEQVPQLERARAGGNDSEKSLLSSGQGLHLGPSPGAGEGAGAGGSGGYSLAAEETAGAEAATEAPTGSTSESWRPITQPSWYSTPVGAMLSFRYRPTFR